MYLRHHESSQRLLFFVFIVKPEAKWGIDLLLKVNAGDKQSQRYTSTQGEWTEKEDGIYFVSSPDLKFINLEGSHLG